MELLCCVPVWLNYAGQIKQDKAVKLVRLRDPVRAHLSATNIGAVDGIIHPTEIAVNPDSCNPQPFISIHAYFESLRLEGAAAVNPDHFIATALDRLGMHIALPLVPLVCSRVSASYREHDVGAMLSEMMNVAFDGRGLSLGLGSTVAEVALQSRNSGCVNTESINKRGALELMRAGGAAESHRSVNY